MHFQHALAAADFDRAATLLETNWLSMDESFQMGTWLGWANQLPLKCEARSSRLVDSNGLVVC
ncbi:MAG: hypothetical protein IPN96_05170 [Anaerolineales bacterium]|nr:hypothetical protein [Anaerolineales bacterium]